MFIIRPEKEQTELLRTLQFYGAREPLKKASDELFGSLTGDMDGLLGADQYVVLVSPL